MTRRHLGKRLVMWRSSQLWLLCLTYGFAAVAYAAQVTLSNGHTMDTDLMEARFIAELHSDSGEAFALIAGRDCVECDENTSLYVREVGNLALLHHLVYDDNHKLLDDRNEYPGKFTDYLTGAIVREVRTFYGRCLGTEADSVVWLVSYKSDNNIWVKAEDALKVHGKLVTHDVYQTSQPDFPKVLSATKAGSCHEIQGIDAPTEP